MGDSPGGAPVNPSDPAQIAPWWVWVVGGGHGGTKSIVLIVVAMDDIKQQRDKHSG